MRSPHMPTIQSSTSDDVTPGEDPVETLGVSVHGEERAIAPFEPLLDDQRAAAFLGGIHPKTLQRMARRGEVPAYRVGRFWRYRASELDEWLRVKSSGRIARVVSMKEKP
jgi:excisionase family DNA binding protein